jgi:opacity protein-like surface antigen
MTATTIVAGLLQATSNPVASWNLGMGMQVYPWLRTELAIDRAVYGYNQIGASIWCPYQAHPIYTTDANGAQENLGAAANFSETCTPYAKGSLNRTSGFVNAYIDVGSWEGFTPYVGAGVGTSYFQSAVTLAYLKNSDGALYSADLAAGMDGFPNVWYAHSPYNGDVYRMVPQPNIPFAYVNWNRKANQKTWAFAWNLMAGVSYDVSQNLKVDLGYRFLSAGTYTSIPNPNGLSVTKNLYSNEVRLGLRLVAN